MEAIVCLSALVIIVILTLISLTHDPSEQRSRLEAKYFDQEEYNRQQKDLLAAEKEAEIAQQKGLIDNEFEDVS